MLQQLSVGGRRNSWRYAVNDIPRKITNIFFYGVRSLHGRKQVPTIRVPCHFYDKFLIDGKLSRRKVFVVVGLILTGIP